MPFFSKVFKSKDSPPYPVKSKTGLAHDAVSHGPKKPAEDPWIRSRVSPEEVQELLHLCTQELKSRALHMPFFLLPFRPVSDPSGAKYFIRNFFNTAAGNDARYRGQNLLNELRLLEPIVLGSVLKWCWSRLDGGVVTWDAYELFKVGERASNLAKHAFDTFIPLSVDSAAKRDIIIDFFDLLAAIAASGKINGLSGGKLSRLAGWWAFEFSDSGKGFDGGYRSWENAANAASHLFFAYLRSLSSDAVGGVSGISKLPRSLESLLAQTQYPPEPTSLMQSNTSKVVMIVGAVSPTPFALLKRAKAFEYRDDDHVLHKFSELDDPLDILTPECRRVLEAISSTNTSIAATDSQLAVTIENDSSWSRFEDMGFSSLMTSDQPANDPPTSRFSHIGSADGLRGTSSLPTRDFGRPKTPSWADFLSEGFATDTPGAGPQPLLLPPSQVLPPIGPSRVHSSQSHLRNGLQDHNLEPGEVASINHFEMDETFWWVWMTSLAAEETIARKAVFGRCALVETEVQGGRWLVLEEQVKGASNVPDQAAYVAEKKSRFTLNRGKTRRSTSTKASDRRPPPTLRPAASKTSILPSQQAKVQAAAAALVQEQQDRDIVKVASRRSRTDPDAAAKTTSVLTLQPVIIQEAGPAMKWASKFDKEAIRAKYLGDASLGKGESREDLYAVANGHTSNLPAVKEPTSPLPQATEERELPPPPPAELIAAKAATSVPPLTTTVPPVTLQPQELSAEPLAPLPIIADQKTPAPPVSNELSELEATHPAPVENTKHEPETVHQDEGAVEQEEVEDHDAGEDEVEALPAKSPALAETVSRTNRAPTIDAAVKAWESKAASSSTTPEKPITPKLKKSGSRTGFKKLFSRNKADKPLTTGSLAVPQTTIVNRQAPKPPTESPYVDTVDAQKVKSDFGEMNSGPGPIISHPHEDNDASHEVYPTAAAIPAPVELSSNTSDVEHSQPQFDAAEDTSLAPSDLAAPNELESNGHNHDLSDDESPTSEVGTNGDSQAVTDRWAQIRKNAMERRLSEERQSQVSGRPSQSGRTVGTERSDEGETSGEETIESRVARIKARVAELTGNLESSRSDGPGGLPPREFAYVDQA